MLSDPERLAAVDRASRALGLRDRGLRRLVHLAAETLGVGYGFLTLVDGDHEHFTAVGGALASRLPLALPVEDSVCRHLVSTDAPLLVPDLQEHPALKGLAVVRALGLRSYAGTPVRDADGLVLGGFCVAHDDVRPWAPAEVALLRGLADAAARELQLLVVVQELERMRVRERRLAEEQAALHRVAVAVARGAAPDEVLAAVARELAALLGAGAAQVLRFEDGPQPSGRARRRRSSTGCARSAARRCAPSRPAPWSPSASSSARGAPSSSRVPRRPSRPPSRTSSSSPTSSPSSW